ncbi:MAG: uracil phosphoribosyltransferase [Planctomycetota bacterium]
MTARGGDPGAGQRHHYGPRVHLLEDAWTATALARIGSPAVSHTELLALLRSVYVHLCRTALAAELATVEVEVPTRMAAAHPTAGVWRGTVLDPAQSVVVIDVIRGGIVPSQACFEELSRLLPLDALRLDHLNMARVAGADGHVDHVDLSGSKVGGSIAGATVILPDPMGATGSTTCLAQRHLREHYGEPDKWVLLPMIATPEYLRAVLDHDARSVVWTTRIDRGLSPPDVLAAPPGLYWDRERGLDAHDYIVPGAGGVGEVLNNSWC